MVWVCPMCSSNNDESYEECMICGSRRIVERSDKVCTLTQRRVQSLGLRGDVRIPEEFNVIGDGAFRDRTDITSIILHEGVRKISKEAFCGCRNLTHIEVRGTLTSIGSRAFADCTSLPASERISARVVADDAYEISTARDTSGGADAMFSKGGTPSRTSGGVSDGEIRRDRRTEAGASGSVSRSSGGDISRSRVPDTDTDDSVLTKSRAPRVETTETRRPPATRTSTPPVRSEEESAEQKEKLFNRIIKILLYGGLGLIGIGLIILFLENACNAIF